MFNDLKFTRESKGHSNASGRRTNSSKPKLNYRELLEAAVDSAQKRKDWANQHGPVKILMKDGIPQA